MSLKTNLYVLLEPSTEQYWNLVTLIHIWLMVGRSTRRDITVNTLHEGKQK